VGRRVRILIFFLGASGLVLAASMLRGRGEADSAGSPPASPVGEIEGRVRVEVLNGGGVSGAAWAATELLRDRGFDVVYFGNAGTYSADSSVVMDRVNEEGSAQAVAEVLGIPHVSFEPDSSLLVDVTVRLGPEWRNPRSGHSAGGPSSVRPVPASAPPPGTGPGPKPSLRP